MSALWKDKAFCHRKARYVKCAENYLTINCPRKRKSRQREMRIMQ